MELKLRKQKNKMLWRIIRPGRKQVGPWFASKALAEEYMTKVRRADHARQHRQ